LIEYINLSGCLFLLDHYKEVKVVKVVFELKIPLSPLLPASEWPVSKNAARFFRKFHLLIMKDFIPNALFN
jgi:hypothetical protein